MIVKCSLATNEDANLSPAGRKAAREIFNTWQAPSLVEANAVAHGMIYDLSWQHSVTFESEAALTAFKLKYE